MELTAEQKEMLDGGQGRASRKAMEILSALGTIYGAERMLPVSSVQISGVSYDNLGEAGLEFLNEMADGGGRTRVLTTLNPAGMDVENWQALGISPDFATSQERVLLAFARMGVITTCTCTPYLIGNNPHFGEHIAWAESSAVCFANSIIGARSNREGGPSALASALTGFTPDYGLHRPENRRPTLTVRVQAQVTENHEFGALGILIGRALEQRNQAPVPWISGIDNASLENLKSFCASLATYGGAGLFHMQGITPEAGLYPAAEDAVEITASELETLLEEQRNAAGDEVDFVSLGCPHLSIHEIARIASLLEGKRVKKTFWITTARSTRQLADRAGYTRIIEEAGAIFAADTCCVVAPIQGRFRVMVTDSAKACYYARSKNQFLTSLRSFDETVLEALR